MVARLVGAHHAAEAHPNLCAHDSLPEPDAGRAMRTSASMPCARRSSLRARASASGLNVSPTRTHPPSINAQHWCLIARSLDLMIPAYCRNEQTPHHHTSGSKRSLRGCRPRLPNLFPPRTRTVRCAPSRPHPRLLCRIRLPNGWCVVRQSTLRSGRPGLWLLLGWVVPQFRPP